MKPQPLILQIPQPCTENWDAMQPTGCGRHCAVCEKTVVDFTGFSDELLLAYFKRNAGKEICGRVLPSQINKPIVKVKSNTGWSWYAKIAATLLAIQASAVTVFAQKEKKQQVITGTKKANAQTLINGKHSEQIPEVVIQAARTKSSTAEPQISGVMYYNYYNAQYAGNSKQLPTQNPGKPVAITPLPTHRPSLFKRIKHWFRK